MEIKEFTSDLKEEEFIQEKLTTWVENTGESSKSEDDVNTIENVETFKCY